LYEGLDLDALETLRCGLAVLSDETLIKKGKARDYEIAQYAPVHEFIPDPNDPIRRKRKEDHTMKKPEVKMLPKMAVVTMMSTRSLCSRYLPPRNPHRQIRQCRPLLPHPELSLFDPVFFISQN
jgi:hypothetical protein